MIQTIITLLLFVTPTVLADGLLLSLGNSTSKDSSKVSKVGYILETEAAKIIGLSKEYNIEIELSNSSWENLYGPDIKVGSITPFIVYKAPISSYEWFVRFGIGLAYIDQTRWGNRRLGDNWIFEDKLEAGLNLQKKHRVGFSLTHYSNAATNKNNDGANIVSLNYSYHW